MNVPFDPTCVDKKEVERLNRSKWLPPILISSTSNTQNDAESGLSTLLKSEISINKQGQANADNKTLKKGTLTDSFPSKEFRNSYITKKKLQSNERARFIFNLRQKALHLDEVALLLQSILPYDSYFSI